MMCGLPTKERSMCKILGSALVALALASASCDGNPFGNLEAEYSGQDTLESPQPGVDSVTPEPEPDTSSPPVFVCEDKDNDGFCGNAENELMQDCNDDEKSIHPNAAEVCDNVDQNCNGIVDESTGSVWYLDADGDGFGDSSESIVDGCDGANFLVSIGNDCDDSDANVNPNATEVCNGIDDDCDEDVDDEDISLDELTQKSWYFDDDNDGFGDEDVTLSTCDQPSDYVGNKTDCDDSTASVNPDEDEVCDEADNDCNGLSDEGVQTFSYLDDDGDGFGNTLEVSVGCGVPVGYVIDKTDCDDSESHTYPGGGEICDGEDNNCDGKTDEVAAGENLCDDNDKLTTEVCEGEDGCVYTDVTIELECFLPKEFPEEDGFECGVAGFYETDDGYGGIFFNQNNLFITAKNLCAELENDGALHTNSYVVEDGNPFTFWVGGQYMTVIDDLTGIEVIGTPGDVTVLVPGLDFLFFYEDFEICQ
jgi:hypothetical protein